MMILFVVLCVIVACFSVGFTVVFNKKINNLITLTLELVKKNTTEFNALIEKELNNLLEQKDKLEYQLDNYFDIMSETRGALAKNLESFSNMLDEFVRREGYMEPEVIKQVISSVEVMNKRMQVIVDEIAKKIKEVNNA